MGIESDQLVFDYLSRVGDLAQQQQLTSGDRMRLVSTLRGEIDRQRAKAIGGPDSAAVVQRILGRLGTPDEIVEAAGEGGVEAVLSSRTSRRVLPRQRRATADGSDLRDAARNGKRGEEPVGFEKEPAAPFPTGPHLAGTDELGSGGEGPEEWWRADPGPFGGLGTSVPGFTGGVEVPEILKPPRAEDDEDGDDGEEADGEEADGEGEEGPARHRLIPRRLRRRTAPAKAKAEAEEEAEEEAPLRAPLVPRGSPFLLLAALLLVTGAVLGNLIVLGCGWFLAYFSRRLTRPQAKWAVLGLPGLVAAGGVVWLWGRTEGRWGAPLSLQVEGAMGDALVGLWPVLLRTAAGLTALYVVWRARRLSE